MESLFGEKVKVVSGVQPADLNAAGATGARVKFDESYRMVFVVHFGAGAGVVDVTLRQHDAAAAGTSKDLSIDNHYFLSLDGAAFTKTEVSVAAANYAPAGTGGAYGILELEVLPEQLDNANGFSWISLDVTDPAAAKVIGVEYLAMDLKKKPVV